MTKVCMPGIGNHDRIGETGKPCGPRKGATEQATVAKQIEKLLGMLFGRQWPQSGAAAATQNHRDDGHSHLILLASSESY
jgi:hypothetical protein